MFLVNTLFDRWAASDPIEQIPQWYKEKPVTIGNDANSSSDFSSHGQGVTNIVSALTVSVSLLKI